MSVIIRSQDNKRIVNFDVCHLSITKDHCIVATNGVVSYPSEILSGLIGEYSTEEKAIKVLDMIQEAYNSIETMKIDKEAWRDNHYFNMPQDSEI